MPQRDNTAICEHRRGIGLRPPGFAGSRCQSNKGVEVGPTILTRIEDLGAVQRYFCEILEGIALFVPALPESDSEP